MSWLSQGLSDVGLGGLNTFYNSAIKPALENPIVDVGLGLGAGALTGGLLLPEIGSALGLGGAADAAATTGGIDAITTGAAASAAPDSLAGLYAAASPADYAALGLDPTSFLGGGNPLATAGGTDFPSSAVTSVGAGNVVPTSGLPSLASSVSAATPDLSNFSSGLGDYLNTSAFDPSTWTGATASAPSTTGGLGTYEGNVVSPANAGPQPAQPQGFWPSLAKGLSPTSLGESLGKAFGNPLTLVGLGGLGYNLYSGYEQKQALNQLTSQEQQLANQAQQTQQQDQAAAAPLLSQGNTLISYLTTNTLPPQFQSQIQ